MQEQEIAVLTRRSTLISLAALPLTFGAKSAAAQEGGRAQRILMVGSSSEAARGVGTGRRQMDDARPGGYLMQAMNRLAARGASINTEATFGNQGNGDILYDLIAYDRRLHDLSGMEVSAANGMGGQPLRFRPGVAGTYRLDIAPEVDEAIVYTAATRPGQTVFASLGDGEERRLVFEDTEVARLHVTGPKAPGQTLSLRTPADNLNSVYVLGVEPYLAGRAEFRGLIAGSRGWSTEEWVENDKPYSPLRMLDVIRPDYVLNAFGGNEDFTQPGSLDAFIARCSLWYDRVEACGGRSITLLKPQTGGGPAGVGRGQADRLYDRADRTDAQMALAQARNVPVFDLSGPAGPFSKAVAAGEVVTENPPHYSASWHARVGAAVGDWLMDVALKPL